MSEVVKESHFKKLREICFFFTGFQFKAHKYKNKGKPILKMSSIQEGEIWESNLSYFKREDYKGRRIDKCILNPGDLFIVSSGKRVMKVAINNTNKSFYFNQTIKKIEIFENSKLFFKLLNNNYLFNFIRNIEELKKGKYIDIEELKEKKIRVL